MKVLVTGGAGFIGSNLTSALVKERDVTVIRTIFTRAARATWMM